jgi:hypothetical protein
LFLILIFSCGVMVAPLILVQKIVVRVHAGKLSHLVDMLMPQAMGFFEPFPK